MNHSVENSIRTELQNKGADFVVFADISDLSIQQSKGYPYAILFGIALSPEYLYKVCITSDYAEKMKREKSTDKDEFNIIEQKTDIIADNMAEFLKKKGYSAYSQSEKNILSTGYYDEKNKITPLPHKTIAGIAGLGWIGKHDLLVTPDYGSAISMCTILTNAPVKTALKDITLSGCGDCSICAESCEVKAIKGISWEYGISRDEIIDINLCTSCLKCMVLCPWTQKYLKSGLKK